MPTSVVHRGRVMDIVCRNRRSFGGGAVVYDVWVGDIRVGTVTRLGRYDGEGWEAYSYLELDRSPKHPARVRANRMRRASGFGRRRAAATYLVRHWGFGDWEQNG